MTYPNGTPVVITGGDFAGCLGYVEVWDEVYQVYVVHIEDRVTGQVVHAGAQPSELLPIALNAPVADVPQFGLTSAEFASYTEDFIRESIARIRGVGDEQYSKDGYQQFEEMEIDDLFEYAEEEIRDIANYAAMLHIRIRRLRKAFKGAE